MMAEMRQKAYALIESTEREHQLVAIMPLISSDPVFELRVHRLDELTSQSAPRKMTGQYVKLGP
jgi:hypothetical protein